MPSKTIVAIICITILLSLAVWQKIDGVLLSGGLMLIAGLGGYAVAKSRKANGKG